MKKLSRLVAAILGGAPAMLAAAESPQPAKPNIIFVLYDMSGDLGELRNRQTDDTAEVARMTQLMEKFVADGRSTPGPPQNNDASIKLRK